LTIADVFEPVEGVQEDAVNVVAFIARRHLDAWLASQRRRALLAEIEPHLAQDRVTNVVGGFGGWFPGEGPHEVRRWKQAALVLLALYPTALLPDLSLVPAVFLANAAGVAILSWLLMPWLTRTLDGWLRR
jgi:antibiotic biosynthesis monooxygenase (ABM) superfamily enzyme